MLSVSSGLDTISRNELRVLVKLDRNPTVAPRAEVSNLPKASSRKAIASFLRFVKFTFSASDINYPPANTFIEPAATEVQAVRESPILPQPKPLTFTVNDPTVIGAA